MLAAIARHTAFSALSFRGSCIDGCERDMRTALIYKDELGCWQWAYFCSPGGSLLLVALRGTQRFFSVRAKVPTEQEWPSALRGKRARPGACGENESA